MITLRRRDESESPTTFGERIPWQDIESTVRQARARCLAAMKENPGATLGVAFLAGALLGWWVKR